MKIGWIPEYEVNIPEDAEGIPMVRVVSTDGRTLWVELHDPILDGKTITREPNGALAAE